MTSMDFNSTDQTGSIADPAVEDGLLDQIDAAVFAVDAAGRCTRMNAAAEGLLGYSRSEVLGREMHQMVHSRSTYGVIHAAAEDSQEQAGEPFAEGQDSEDVLWSKSGEPIPVTCTVRPLASGGVHGGAVVTLKDLRPYRAMEQRLTERMRQQEEALRQRDATSRIEHELAAAESIRQRDLSLRVEQAATDKLREQHELLSTVAEIAPIGIAVFDMNLRFRWYNACYRNFLDTRFEDRNLTGISLFDTMAKKKHPALRAIQERAKQTGKPFLDEEFLFDGFERGMTYWRLSVTRLENGELVIVVADLTEQVRARREIETIYGTAPIGLFLLREKDLTILRANERQAEVLGIPCEQLIGKRLEDAFPLPEVLDLLRSAAQGETIYNRLISGVLPNRPEEERHWLISVLPNRSHGMDETISVACNEITAQKRTESALMQADKLAAVGRLAASISHEINNPLEAVTNLLYLVHNDSSLSRESSEYIKMAEGELQRVSQIASQTLRFHRHAVGPAELMPEQLVEPVIALYQGRLKNTRIEVKRNYRDSQPVTTFEGDVRQVLNNLIGNAIDAIGEGGTIRIRTRKATCPRTHRSGIRITVADSGPGMKPETLARVFEPFYTTKGASGSGLGLWISRTIAERHQGTLRGKSLQRQNGRQSRLKTGTTFSFFIPNAQTDIEDAGREEQRRWAEETGMERKRA